MREGPALDEAETMSSQVLLEEIANLRKRLRDLEDDGRSSFCESFVDGSDMSMMMKKEVVKLTDEKAKQEKEFMNQMTSLAIENQNIIADLKSKFARSRATAEELEDRVEAMTDNHADEINRLKENLTRADEEIAEARQEIDYLQHENEELRATKSDLHEDSKALRIELENEKRRSNSYLVQLKKSEEKIERLRLGSSSRDNEVEELRQQVGEMNDTIIELEEQKNSVEGQLKLVQAELAHANHRIQQERNKSLDQSVFSAEKESLERSCEQLEERLERFQVRLAEKDTTIENLTIALKEERSICRKIRKDLKEERECINNNEESDSGLNGSLHGTRTPHKELEYLRRRNQSLNDELYELRHKLNETDKNSDDVHKESAIERSKYGVQLHPISSPPRLKKGGDAVVSPRAAVSGLVASFEKRIHRRGDEKREETGSSCASDWSPSTDKSVDLREAQRTIHQLERELQEEREVVASLRKQLSCAKEGSESINSVELKLEQSMKQIERFKKKVDVLEKEKRQCYTDIEQFQNDMRVAKEIAALEEEKKDEERGEEVSRLRSQVGALQAELSRSMKQVEELNDQIWDLQQSLDKEKRLNEELQTCVESTKTDVTVKESLEKRQNTEINKLKVELTNLHLAKDDIEAELRNRIEDLETEFEAMEIVANQEIDDLKSELVSMQSALSGKDDQINRLETEKNQLCMNMSMASHAKNDEFEELQSELIDKTAKNTSQAREIQVLTMKIEELESVKRGKAEWLQSRVSELEQEIEHLKSINKKSGSWEDIERLRHENIQLKETIREIKMERRNLQDRVETLVGERTSSKSVQILRERNASLKDEVEKLTRRLKKMEESITRFAI